MKKPSMTPRERDAAMDRLLREAIAADVRSAPGACLDAETLAAWAEGTLSKAEQTVAETHASRCERCQAMLAAMVRTEAPVAAPSRSPFLGWVMTLGPVAAAAAALILWFAVDRRSAVPVLPEQPAVVARAPDSTHAAGQNGPAATTPTEIDAFRAGRDQADKKAVNKEASDETRAAGRIPSPPVGAIAGQLRDRNEGAGGAAGVAETVKVAPKPADREREVLVESAPASSAGALAATAPPPPAAAAAATRPAAEPVIPPVPSLDQVQEKQRQNAASPSQQAAQTQTQTVSGYTQNEMKVQGRSGDRRALLARADAAALVVASPIPAVRWRVVDGRNVQFSMDGGQIWATQYTVDAPTLIVAGAAPTSTACWLVGQAGLVLVTKDGRTWQRVKFPERTDLAKVSATDAMAAVVVTTDGRTFTTSDSGSTWKQF